MLNLFTFIACGLCLIISIACGMHSTIDKHTGNWLVISRLLLFIMLIGKIVVFLANLPAFAWFSLVQIILLVILFIMVEMIFRRKLLTFGAPWMALVLEFTTTIVCLICIF